MNIQKIMKQAQQAKKRMEEIQEELTTLTVEASAGGGMVKVVMTGDQVVQSVKLDPAAVDPEDIDMLEDLIVAAVNEASRMAAELAANRMEEVTGGLQGLGLPGM